MLEPIIIENDVLLIHPLRPVDVYRHDQIANDIFEILSDKEATEFIPEKRITSLEQAEMLLMGISLAYEQKRNFTHFITIKEFNKVIGIIDIIHPDTAKQNYIMPEYNWMVEYYLTKMAWGRYIMTDVLPAITDRIFKQGITKLGAITFRNNYGSVRVLEKSGFINKYQFDYYQDYYEAKPS